MTKVRHVQLSAFPDLQADKPVGQILPSVFTGTNADLMAAVAPFYLTGSVCDVTYGDGAWWTRFQPAEFVGHDLYKLDGVDFRSLPEATSSVDTVCFDPPYVPAGGGPTNHSADEFRGRFGLDWGEGYRSEAVLADLIRGGLNECARVARAYVLVKCMEFVSSSRFHDMPVDIATWARDAGLVKHDTIVHHTGSGPGGHNIFDPIRARRHHSYLLVFTKGAP